MAKKSNDETTFGRRSLLLLLGTTNGLSSATSGLGVLTSNSQVPVVSKTSVQSDLFHSLEIVSELDVQVLVGDLGGLAVLVVTLSVKEPLGDVELEGVGDDGLDGLNLVLAQLASSAVEVNAGLLANQVGESRAQTSNLAESINNLVSAIDVGVQDTQDMLELLVFNNNVDGRHKVVYALRKIRGLGPRFSNLVCKKAGIDLNARAGELSDDQIDEVKAIIANPLHFNIPEWFLNRQRDHKDGKTSQITHQNLDIKLRDDLERMKKIRLHRGLRHYWNLRVRGQHTKTTGRRGKSVGGAKKKE